MEIITLIKIWSDKGNLRGSQKGAEKEPPGLALGGGQRCLY